jgi:hypothetical protein
LGSILKGSKTLAAGPALKIPPPGEWALFRMIVRGQNLRLEVPGQPSLEFDSLDSPTGYLGLQAEGKAFEFRNLRLQELSGME